MVLALLALATAQSASPAQPRLQAPPPIDCNSPEHHQFDFWVGEWDVTPAAAGRGPSGHSSITKVVNGCAISEHFVAPPGAGRSTYEGVSYGAYDAFERRWNNYYVDSRGHPMWFTGGFDGSGMILWSFQQAPQGAYMRRMEIVPQSDGSVRQSGFVTLDNGRNWRPIYDLIYRRSSR